MSNAKPLRVFPLTIATAMVFALLLPAACSRKGAPTNFATPEEGVQALIQAVKGGKLDDVIAIFGAEGKELIDSSDAATARQNQQVFLAATAEHWRLEPQGTNGRVLVIGKEAWPFPVPLVQDSHGWHFDTAAGKEEIIARRIGRNELAVIRLCRTYVAAQRLYAQKGHDGRPAGLFAATFRSDPGRENGLYWPAAHGQKRSPLGDLVAGAAEEGRAAAQNRAQPSPFHGYYFRILTAQGPDAPGGAIDYLVDGQLTRGFALIAWPAQYDVTGVMTFLVSHEGNVREKDLGADTAAAADRIRVFNPDASWAPVQSER
jgi:DUF2950 family protein